MSAPLGSTLLASEIQMSWTTKWASTSGPMKEARKSGYQTISKCITFIGNMTTKIKIDPALGTYGSTTWLMRTYGLTQTQAIRLRADIRYIHSKGWETGQSQANRKTN